jgi:D-xylose transport system substrate-binding protein
MLQGLSTALRSRTAIVCAGSLAVATLLAVGPLGAGAEEAKKKILVGFSMKTHVQFRWDFDEAAIRAAAKKHGVDVVFQWANDSVTTQASQFENLISQKPDVIATNPVDSAAIGPQVREAQEAGIKVLGYNVGVSTAKLDFQVRRDDIATGTIQAESALRFAPKGNYAIIMGDPGNDVAHVISGVYDKILRKNPNIKIVYDNYTANWDPKAAQAIAENVLTANNDDIAAFVVMNDGMASGVAAAIKSRNLEGKIFVSGLDGDPANMRLIAEGAQTMTVYQDYFEGGERTIQAAVALADDKLPDMPQHMTNDGAGEYPVHELAVMEINKDNLCDFVFKIAPPGYIKAEDVWPDKPDACKK